MPSGDPKLMSDPPLVEMRHIHKAFGGIHAVEGVSVSVMPGEVVGIVGHIGVERQGEPSHELSLIGRARCHLAVPFIQEPAHGRNAGTL